MRLVKVKLRARTDFTKNLAMMLKSGVPITEALRSLEKQSGSKKLSKVVGNIRSKVERGTSLSEAIKDEDVFGPIFTGIVEAGERSGSLSENLLFLADWLETNHKLRKDIRSATLYPKIIITAAFLLGGGLSTFLLPKLIPLFNQLDTDLPWTTQVLMDFTSFLQNEWALVIGLIVGVFVLWNVLKRIEPTKYILDYIGLRIPVIGNMIRIYQLALLSHIIGVLYRSGLPIVETMEISSEAVSNEVYRRALLRIKEDMEKGISMTKALNDFPVLFPPNFINMISTGEKSGTLDETFGYLSDFYSKEIKSKVRDLPTIVEPVLIVLIGLVVGFVALSIILPIYQLTSQFG